MSRCGPRKIPDCGFVWTDQAEPHWVHECVSPAGHDGDHLCAEGIARSQGFRVTVAGPDDELGQLLASALNGRPAYRVPLTREPDLGGRDPVIGQRIVNVDLPEHR